jgi:hypothetical protein
VSEDWAYGPIDPADRALAGKDAEGVPAAEDALVEARRQVVPPAPARSRRPQLRLRADPGARSWALLIDLVLLFVVGFVVVFVAFIASTPFWDVPDPNDGARSRTAATGAGSASVYALNETVPSWVSWAIVAVLAAVAVLLSGAARAPGRRRSLGLAIAELRLATWPLVTTDPAHLPPGWTPEAVEAGQLRVAARWLLPLALFAVLSLRLSGMAAGLLVLAGWAPSLVGARRSLYDLVAGVVVVDAVRLAGLATDAKALEVRSPDRL